MTSLLASLFGKNSLDLDNAISKASLNNKDRLRSDVESLVKTRKTLKPQFDASPIDGSQEGLFRLVGTLPTLIQGATYECPVSIYFDVDYPNQAPRCFITPGQNWDGYVDILGPGHKMNLEYLSCWSADESTLTDLVEAIRSAFEDKQASKSDDMTRVLIWLGDMVSASNAALDGIEVWYPSRGSASIHKEVLRYILTLLLREKDTKQVFSVFLESPSRYPCILEDIRKLFEVRGLALPKFITCEQSENGSQGDHITIAKDSTQALQIVREIAEI